MAKIKLSDYVAKRLKEHGVDHFFVISGGGAMHLNDSFGKFFSYTALHNEQAMAYAAEGYARVNQRLALVNPTSGPGGLNCLSGLFGQWTDSVPVIYVSGQVKFETTMASCPEIPIRQLGFQETNIIQTVQHITKYSHMLREANEIKYHIDRAVYEATTGRMGPVWLDIPMDLQGCYIEEDDLIEFTPPQKDNFDLKIDEVIELLNKAEAPLIIAGHGIRLSGAKDEFLQLVEKLNIPVITSLNGFDIIDNEHPSFISRYGAYANRAGTFVLQNADVVLALGGRHNLYHTSYNWKSYAKNAKLISVDIDQAELDKPTLNIAVKVKADVKEFINGLLPRVSEIKCDEWKVFCKKIKDKFPPLTEAPRSEHNPIEPYYFINTLIKQFKEDEVSISSNGSTFLLPFQVGEVKKNQRFIWNAGCAAMGFGLPASIGACVANDKKSVVCIEGDGSLMMNIQELETIVHNKLPIKLFLLNNGGYVSIQQTHRNFFAGRLTACSESSGVSMPDFYEVAKAFKLHTVRIDSIDNIEEKINEVLNYDGAVFCEVILTKDYFFLPKLASKALEDGTMVSPSLEDMFPFLDREEFDDCFFKESNK